MKTTKQTWFVLLTVAGSLLLTPLVPAQQTNAAADAQMSAPTNSPDGGQTPAVSNTPASSAASSVTNEAATNQEDENRGQPQPIVMFGQNVELKAGDTADVVVVIGGSAKVHGKVRQAVVTIGGSSEVDGEVGEAVVAVMGNVHLKPGANIHEDAVAVMGTLTVDSGVKIAGDAVSVGGKFNIADGAKIHGQRVNVGLPIPFANIEWLGKWLKYCAFEFRPLAPQVGFVWIIAGMFFLLYLLVAAVFPRPVQVCVDGLNQRPATTFLMGLLTKILVPVVVVILAVTGIGLIVVPFLMAALFFGAVVGKVAILEWLGMQIGRHFGTGFQKPLVAFLIGTMLLTLLYLVPILGLLTYTIFSVWGLGCAVTATFSSMRREMPEKPTVPPLASGPPPVTAAMAAAATAPVIPPAVVPTGPAAGAMESPGASTPGNPPPVVPQAQIVAGALPVTPPVHILSLPRAGFWERMGAAFLDIVFVCIVIAVGGRLFEHYINLPFKFVIVLAYFAGLWAWKGTTIGGVVLKLQVVRHDGGPLTFLVALVRGLAAAFSAVVFFLGFFWIGWDREKQGWHDKIAGTVVVRLPRSTPLVCL
ncbi:MAG: RDD family protein [Limisphaerales bacterium]